MLTINTLRFSFQVLTLGPHHNGLDERNYPRRNRQFYPCCTSSEAFMSDFTAQALLKYLPPNEVLDLLTKLVVTENC